MHYSNCGMTHGDIQPKTVHISDDREAFLIENQMLFPGASRTILSKMISNPAYSGPLSPLQLECLRTRSGSPREDPVATEVWQMGMTVLSYMSGLEVGWFYDWNKKILQEGLLKYELQKLSTKRGYSQKLARTVDLMLQIEESKRVPLGHLELALKEHPHEAPPPPPLLQSQKVPSINSPSSPVNQVDLIQFSAKMKESSGIFVDGPVNASPPSVQQPPLVPRAPAPIQPRITANLPLNVFANNHHHLVQKNPYSLDEVPTLPLQNVNKPKPPSTSVDFKASSAFDNSATFQDYFLKHQSKQQVQERQHLQPVFPVRRTSIAFKPSNPIPSQQFNRIVQLPQQTRLAPLAPQAPQAPQFAQIPNNQYQTPIVPNPAPPIPISHNRLPQSKSVGNFFHIAQVQHKPQFTQPTLPENPQRPMFLTHQRNSTGSGTRPVSIFESIHQTNPNSLPAADSLHQVNFQPRQMLRTVPLPTQPLSVQNPSTNAMPFATQRESSKPSNQNANRIIWPINQISSLSKGDQLQRSISHQALPNFDPPSRYDNAVPGIQQPQYQQPVKPDPVADQRAQMYGLNYPSRNTFSNTHTANYHHAPLLLAPHNNWNLHTTRY